VNTADAGYAIFSDVLDPARLTNVRESLVAVHQHRTKAGVRHVLCVPAVRQLANDPSVVSLARAFLNVQPVPFRATLFDKSSIANWLVTWHQDTVLPLTRRVDDPTWGPWTVKAGILHANAPVRALEQIVALRIHLDDSGESNGPLRVLPGTHTGGVLTHEEIRRAASAIRPVDCVARTGGVVAMRPLVVHASSKSSDDRPRRVLHIEYAASIQIARGLELAMEVA
jgi:ectoine hydroxylase-related dioxygenase (phytanoyl-CoA dioxygenase family)